MPIDVPTVKSVCASKSKLSLSLYYVDALCICRRFTWRGLRMCAARAGAVPDFLLSRKSALALPRGVCDDVA